MMDRRPKKAPAPASNGPHDALADLMDGVTPKQEALRCVLNCACSAQCSTQIKCTF